MRRLTAAVCNHPGARCVPRPFSIGTSEHALVPGAVLLAGALCSPGVVLGRLAGLVSPHEVARLFERLGIPHDQTSLVVHTLKPESVPVEEFHLAPLLLVGSARRPELPTKRDRNRVAGGALAFDCPSGAAPKAASAREADEGVEVPRHGANDPTRTTSVRHEAARGQRRRLTTRWLRAVSRCTILTE